MTSRPRFQLAFQFPILIALAVALGGCSLWADSQANSYVGRTDGGGLDSTSVDDVGGGDVSLDDVHAFDANAEVAVDVAVTDARADVSVADARADVGIADVGTDTSTGCGDDMRNSPRCPVTTPECYRNVCVTRACNTTTDCTGQPILAGFQCVSHVCTDCDYDDDGSQHRESDVTGPSSTSTYMDGCNLPFGMISDCDDNDQVAPVNNRCGGWTPAFRIFAGDTAVAQLAVRTTAAPSAAMPEYQVFARRGTNEVAEVSFDGAALTASTLLTPNGWGNAIAIGTDGHQPGLSVLVPPPSSAPNNVVTARRVAATNDRNIAAVTLPTGTYLRPLGFIATAPDVGNFRPYFLANVISGSLNEYRFYNVQGPATQPQLSYLTLANVTLDQRADAVLPQGPGAAHVFFFETPSVGGGAQLAALNVSANIGGGGAPVVESIVVPLAAGPGIDRIGLHAHVLANDASSVHYVLAARLRNQPGLARITCAPQSSGCTVTNAVVGIMRSDCLEVDAQPTARGFAVYASCGDEILRVDATVTGAAPNQSFSFATPEVLVRRGYLQTAPGLDTVSGVVSIRELHVVGEGIRRGIAFIGERGQTQTLRVSRVFFLSYQ